METGGQRWIVYPSRSDEFTIHAIGDIHYGNAACALDRCKADIEAIRVDPRAFWFGLGDYAEYIGPGDKRWNAKSVSKEITIGDLANLGKMLTTKVRDLFAPIKYKCLGLLLGNHETKYMAEKDQVDLHAWLCTELGAVNLGYSGFTDVIFRRRPGCKPGLYKTPPPMQGDSYNVRFFLHHGAGSANTAGGKMNRLDRFMRDFGADVYFIAHVHDQVGKRRPVITANADCSKITAEEPIGVITGSYLRTYAQGVTTYGEVKGYAPVPLGASFVRINPQSHTIHGEI